MAFNIISAAEAATYIKHGYNVGLSGFTPAGSPKAVTPEIAKIAEAEHAAGRPFQIGIFTGASTGDSADGALIRAKAIRYRAPYTTNADFRKAVNNGEVAYNDIHLSQMAQEIRYGYYGKINVAIIEACHVTPDGKIYLTAAGGISPTIARLADHIIIELNAAHRGTDCIGLHDVYEPIDPPYRREIPVYHPSDRIGLPYLQVDPKKIVGIVEVNIPDEARGFTAPDPVTDKIGQNVAEFLLSDMRRGIIPPTFLPLQSGVGNIANAEIDAMQHQVRLMKDVAVLDQLYNVNLANFKELSMYILAGKKKLEEVRTTQLPALIEKAQHSNLPEDTQAANDMAAMCNRFEKKIHDLELTRAISIQMAPQIRLIQNNDTVMSEKIQTTIVNTIPLWKGQMVIALGLAHSQQALKAQQQVTDLTNELLKKNAEALKLSTIETAKASERGIVDIETLKATNETLISTLDEVVQIQADGRQKRRDAEAELARIEDQLKNKLLEMKG